MAANVIAMPNPSHVYFVRRRRQPSPLEQLLAGAEEVMLAGDYLTARAIYLDILRCEPACLTARRGLDEVRALLLRECRISAAPAGD